MKALRCLVLAAFGACSVVAQAAELRWPGRVFETVVSDKKLTEFLRELAASQGTTAVIDPKVDGVISGRFAIGRGSDKALRVLEDVTANYGLTWYFDGALLYIEPAAEAREEMISIAPENASRIQAALTRSQVGDNRFKLQVSAADGQVRVSGPRRYLDAVRQVVQGVELRNRERDRSEVRIFPLRFAWANDFEIRRASGRGATVPGVVTVLRGLFDPRHAGRRGAQGTMAMGGATQMPRVTGPRSFTLPSGGTATAPRIEFPGDEGVNGAVLSGSPHADLPQFQADSRMNAVLIRDLPERMPEYERLIASMDSRPRLVEIEVTIMDISHDSLDRLGVDWRAHGYRYDVQTGSGGVPAASWTSVATAAGQTGVTTPVGALFSATIGHELRNFLLARVSALAQEGQASFVARPKVLTLDNTEASIENKSEFFVKVDGFQDAALFSVVAGTEVRVVPLLVDEREDVRSVLLNINIGDDNVTSDAVQNVPVVRRRSVVSQAIVEEGKSVLLAGYSSEERINGSRGVPVLSTLPVVGNLFKYSEAQRTTVERFYMLTPRYVLPEVAAARMPIDPMAVQ